MAYSDSLKDWNGTGTIDNFEDTCYKQGYMDAIQQAAMVLMEAGVDNKFIQLIWKLDDSPLDTGN